MNKAILVTATLFGITGIILGAFAAHGLKQLISVESLQTFETGVKYQIYHAIFLLIVGTANTIRPNYKRIMYYLTLIGILFFSGSIYGLATNSITTFDFKAFGIITPIGGLLLILAWVLLLINFLTMKKDKLQN
jgi:uncharacterized membrane protein YgdD (TMEM256/DUF423 family)